MDPFTIAMLGTSVLGGLQKQDQARRQGIIDMAKAKWAGFNKDWAPSQAPEGHSILNDLAGGLMGAMSAEQGAPELVEKFNTKALSAWDKLFSSGKKDAEQQLAEEMQGATGQSALVSPRAASYLMRG